jgi:NADH-quinone oxidoreductase subunit L
MRQMGGLRKLMPITFVTFLIGGLAQAGIPPLAGFFAKEAVLEIAQHSGREAVFVLTLFAAFLSAFYIGRMLIMTFFGAPRSDAAHHAHESAPVIWVPLAILGAGVALAGLLELGPEGALSTAMEPLMGAIPEGSGMSVLAITIIGVVISVAALAITWLIYGSGRVEPARFREGLEPWATSADRGWYVDRAYDLVVIQPLKVLARMIGDVFDRRVVDGAVNGIGDLVRRAGRGGRLVQTGFVRTYALVSFLGAVLVLGIVGVRG